MVLRFRDTNGHYRIITVSYVEIEDAHSGEIHSGKWVFKDDTYSVGHNENFTKLKMTEPLDRAVVFKGERNKEE